MSYHLRSPVMGVYLSTNQLAFLVTGMKDELPNTDVVKQLLNVYITHMVTIYILRMIAQSNPCVRACVYGP